MFPPDKKTSRAAIRSRVPGKGGAFLPDRVRNADAYLPANHLAFQHLLPIPDAPLDLLLRVCRVLRLGLIGKAFQKSEQVTKSLAVKIACPGFLVHKPVQRKAEKIKKRLPSGHIIPQDGGTLRHPLQNLQKLLHRPVVPVAHHALPPGQGEDNHLLKKDIKAIVHFRRL